MFSFFLRVIFVVLRLSCLLDAGAPRELWRLARDKAQKDKMPSCVWKNKTWFQSFIPLFCFIEGAMGTFSIFFWTPFFYFFATVFYARCCCLAGAAATGPRQGPEARRPGRRLARRWEGLRRRPVRLAAVLIMISRGARSVSLSTTEALAAIFCRADI